MAVKITQKYELFKDVDGDPLENGYIYIGTTGLNPEISPITVYFDEALTLPASQPLRTSGGYIQNAGTPANIYVDSDYSITVRNKNETLIYTSLSNNAEAGLSSSVDTIGDLIGLDEATTTEELEVYGYHAKGDGAGGLFIWASTTSKANANGGTIVDPSVSLANQGTGVGTGCWIRQYSGTVNARWFGAIADGTTDDTLHIQRALDTLENVDLEGLSYASDTLTIKANNQKLHNGELIGFGYTGTGLSGINADSIDEVFIDNIILTQDSSVSASSENRGIYLTSCLSPQILNCKITNFGGAGIRLDGCFDANINKNYIYECMRVAEGSTDVTLAYGAIAIFGESIKSNRCSVLNNYVYTNSTGISIAAGEGHEIAHNTVVASSSVSELAMGIYCLESLSDLIISSNFIEGFYNEGIDVHNTGATPRADISNITISNNVCTDNSYVGISVVSSSGYEISNLTISGNSVLSETAGTSFGFSHGILIEYVKNASINGNSTILSSATPTLTSYGIYISDSDRISCAGNIIGVAYDKNIYTNNSGDITIGSNTMEVKAGASGISFATGTKNRFAVVGNTIKGTDATSVLLNKESGGANLQYATISANSLNIGTLNLDATQHLVFTGNMCNSLTTPTITDSGQGLIGINKGYNDTEAGTTKTTPGTVDQWLPIVRSGTTYYIPMYTSKTS